MQVCDLIGVVTSYKEATQGQMDSYSAMQGTVGTCPNQEWLGMMLKGACWPDMQMCSRAEETSWAKGHLGQWDEV
jgi:hypothetical protein